MENLLNAIANILTYGSMTIAVVAGIVTLFCLACFIYVWFFDEDTFLDSAMKYRSLQNRKFNDWVNAQTRDYNQARS